MFTRKTTVTRTTTTGSDKVSKGFDDLMAKGSDLLDAGMNLMDEVFNGEEEVQTVTTTIRIRLNVAQVAALAANRTLTFKAEGTTILLEGGKS